MSYCPSCGAEIQSEVKFCSSCGASIMTNVGTNLHNDSVNTNTSFHGNSGSSQHTIPLEMNLVNAFKRVVLENYANFNGRASKAEYWWYILATIIVSIGASVIDLVLGTTIINSLISLALFVPGIAVAARRLHDTNRSGWWQLIAITIIGLIPLIIWLVQSSDQTENSFGSVPTV